MSMSAHHVSGRRFLIRSTVARRSVARAFIA